MLIDDLPAKAAALTTAQAITTTTPDTSFPFLGACTVCWLCRRHLCLSFL